MEPINLYDAKTNLSSLVDRAAAGEEITIAKAGKPLAKLVPLTREAGPRPYGLYRDQIRIGDDFDDSLPQEIQDAFDGKGK